MSYYNKYLKYKNKYLGLKGGTRFTNPDIFYFIKTKNLEEVRKLLDLGIDVNSRINLINNPDGITLLTYAINFGNLDIIKLLFDRGVNVNSGRLVLSPAIMRENLEIIKFLINKGATINVPDDYSNYDIPIFMAVTTKNPIIVKTLIDAGANINYQNFYKSETVLHHCINIADDYNMIPIIEILIDHGININTKDKNGYTALNKAIILTDRYANQNYLSYMNNYFSITKYLIFESADQNIKDYDKIRYDFIKDFLSKKIEVIKIEKVDKEDLVKRMTCPICYINLSNKILDCGHILCAFCAETLQKSNCPFCSKQIDTKKNIYMEKYKKIF
jgi:ankyrin repeat protein